METEDLKRKLDEVTLADALKLVPRETRDGFAVQRRFYPNGQPIPSDLQPPAGIVAVIHFAGSGDAFQAVMVPGCRAEANRDLAARLAAGLEEGLACDACKIFDVDTEAVLSWRGR